MFIFQEINEWPLPSPSMKQMWSQDTDASRVPVCYFFFVFFFVLNNYLQLDYMYRMATRTMHRKLEVGITMNGGRRA